MLYPITFFNSIQPNSIIIFEEILTWFWGPLNKLTYAFIIIFILNFIVTVLIFYINKSLTKYILLKLLIKFFIICLIICISHIIDVTINKTECFFRDLTLIYYIIYEGVNILKNADYIGVPIPQFLKKALKEIRNSKKEDLS